MRDEAEVRSEIERVTNAYGHVLNSGPASIHINGPRALMQIDAVTRLDVLYWALGEKRPHFPYDERKANT